MRYLPLMARKIDMIGTAPEQGAKLNSLGLHKAPEDTRVVVAMSGGVDSSVVAALLKDQGYDVVGITLQLYDHGVAVQKKGACCAGQDIHDARRVSEAIGIPHYVLDYESRFQDAVMEEFADSYIRGETPIPCIRCNQEVKFKDLLETARDLGAEVLATGHYVQQQITEGPSHLYRAVDDNRDQSYFLFATTQQQLDFLRFPLGSLIKDDVRLLAEKYGLAIADKPDSQDICFVPQGNYASVIERMRPGASDAGEIVHIDGRPLGFHKGIIHYTIGQRKGIGIGGGDPLYVVRLDPDKKQVIVGPKEVLEVRSMLLKELNWLGQGELPAEGMALQVKIRSTRPPVAAMLHAIDEGQNQAKIVLDKAERGVSPGQAAVFYDGDRVLGGGWITKAISAWQEKTA